MRKPLLLVTILLIGCIGHFVRPSIAASESESVPTLRGNMARTGENPGPTPSSDKYKCDWIRGNPWTSDDLEIVALSSGLLFTNEVVTLDGDEVTFQNLSDQRIYVDIGSATVVDEIAYAAGYYMPSRRDNRGGAYFAAYDLASYTVIWAAHSEQAGPPFPAPVIAEDIVYFATTGGEVFAYSRSDGTLQWQRNVGGSRSVSEGYTVGVASFGDDGLFIGGSDNRLYALDSVSGAVKWSFELNDNAYAIPMYLDGMVFISGYRVLYALESSTGRVLWQQDISKPWHSSTATYGSNVYVVGGDTLHAFSVEGGIPLWTAKAVDSILEDEAESPRSSPIVVGSELFVGGRDRAIYVFSTSSGDFLERIQVSTADDEQEDEIGSMLIAGRTAYVEVGTSICALVEA